MSKWYSGNGSNSDVVLSSKIRLARNLADAPFPIRMSKEIRKSVSKRIYACIKNSEVAGEFDLIDLSAAGDLQALSYAEQGLISTEFAKNKNQSAFLLSKDRAVSIMLCEDDHIRLSSMAAGQNLKAAYEKADRIDDIWISNLKIAFDQNLGFLTSNPVNLGTGMKAEFTLHLPALKAGGVIPNLITMVGKLGLSLRALYGGNGAFYQLSNQISLGITEQAAMDNLNAVCDQIVTQERNYRARMEHNDEFEDRIFRAMGTLKMARKMGQDEFFELLSLVRLGISLGLLELSYDTVGDMIHSLQNATVLINCDSEISADTAPRLRAEAIRKILF